MTTTTGETELARIQQKIFDVSWIAVGVNERGMRVYVYDCVCGERLNADQFAEHLDSMDLRESQEHLVLGAMLER